MKEYIERETTTKELEKMPAYFESGDIRYGIIVAIDILKKQTPAADVVEVVRCKDCIYFQDRYIELPDGSKRPYKKDEYLVPISAGINVGSYCTKIDYAIVHGYRDCEPSIDKTRLWVSENDFCSYGERKDGE